MSASTLTAFVPIPEGSQATPGLFNSRFQAIQDNVVSVNSVVLPTSVLSGSTWASIGLFANSNNSDYIRFVDSAGQRSTYRIGSAAGGTADGLNIFDESGNTMIASFSKQSIRFYQQVVGPVFDINSDFLNAATQGVGTDSVETRLQAAIIQASQQGKTGVYVPRAMYPYSASSLSFINTIRMVREGGNNAVYDVQAYGASPLGVTSATSSWQGAIDGASVGGGAVYVPPGTYRTTSRITLRANVAIVGDGPQSVLHGSSTFDPNEIMLYGTSTSGIALVNFTVSGHTAALPVAGIQLVACGDSIVRNMWVSYADHLGISLIQGCYDCEISGNVVRSITGATGWGISGFWDIKRCKIHGNSIQDCGAYGILLDDGTTGQTDNLPCLRNVISGNVIETSTTNMWGISVEGGQENVVEGNTINIIGTYGLDIAFGNSTNLIAPLNNIIAGNFVRAVNGMRLTGSYNQVLDNTFDASDSGIILDHSTASMCTGNIIARNTLKGLATSGNKIGIQCSNRSYSETQIVNNYIPSAGQYGILIELGQKFRISNNRIANTQKDAIAIIPVSTLTGLEITNNSVENAGRATPATYAGIRLVTTTAKIGNAKVADNVYTDDTGGAFSSVLIVGAASDFTNTIVARNRSLRGSVQDVDNSGGATVIQNETYDGLNVSSALTVGGTLQVNGLSTLSAGVATSNHTMALLNTTMGYSTAYKVLQLGSTAANRMIAIGIDPLTVAGGSFGGDEILFKNSQFFSTPNAAGTDWVSFLQLQSAGSTVWPKSMTISAGTLSAPEVWATSGISAKASIASLSYVSSSRTVMGGELWGSGISIGGGGTAIPAISSISSKIANFVVQGSSSSFTIVTWAAVKVGDVIQSTIFPDAAVSSMSSGLVLHSHCTQNGQIEVRLSNVSTLVQNQSSKSFYFIRMSAF